MIVLRIMQQFEYVLGIYCICPSSKSLCANLFYIFQKCKKTLEMVRTIPVGL